MRKNPPAPPPPPLTQAGRTRAQGKRTWRTPALRPLDGARSTDGKSYTVLTEIDELTTSAMLMTLGGGVHTATPPTTYSVGPS